MRVSVKMPPPTQEEFDINDKLYEEYNNLVKYCKEYKESTNPLIVVNNELLSKSLKFAVRYEEFYNFWANYNKEDSV